jgi:hypothetical protein
MYKDVVTAVALLGATAPAINSLDDVVALYAERGLNDDETKRAREILQWNDQRGDARAADPALVAGQVRVDQETFDQLYRDMCGHDPLLRERMRR